MEELVLVHDDARIASVVAEVWRARGYSVRVHVCLTPEDLERVKQEFGASLVIRTAQERSGPVFLA